MFLLKCGAVRVVSKKLMAVPVASEAICKWGGTMRSAGRKFSDVPPHFSLVHPHMRGHNDCLLPTETTEVSPSIGSAVCTSTGEVGRGAIKVMGPSDFSVTRN